MLVKVYDLVVHCRYAFYYTEIFMLNNYCFFCKCFVIATFARLESFHEMPLIMYAVKSQVFALATFAKLHSFRKMPAKKYAV